MPKGKKFSAAEKHFEKRKLEYERRIKVLTDNLNTATNSLKELNQELSETKAEKAQLEEWIERLLQYTELSKEDIKAACEKDKNAGAALAMFNRLGAFLGGY